MVRRWRDRGAVTAYGVTPLSVLDAGFVGASAYPIEFVFRYNKGLQRAALQRGLDQTLRDFPVLTSEIEYDGAQRRWVFAPRGRSIQIEERHEGSGRLDSVVTLPGQALLKIVLCRGAAHDTVGVSMSHAVADGSGYFFLLSAWCAALRGEHPPRPTHDRAAVDALAHQGDADQALTPDAFFDHTGISWLPHLDRERLGEVSCQREPLAPPPPLPGVSENALLAAGCLRRWVKRSDPRSVRLSCAVDLRHRAAELSPTFFGNASYGASRRWSRAAYDQLTDADVATQIYQSVQHTNRATAQRVVSALQSLFLREGPGVASFLHVADPATGILVTNLSRLPVAKLDCGVGPPLDFAIVTRAPNTIVVTRKDGELFQSTCTALA